MNLNFSIISSDGPRAYMVIEFYKGTGSRCSYYDEGDNFWKDKKMFQLGP